MTDAPYVTVLIPAWRKEENLRRLLPQPLARADTANRVIGPRYALGGHTENPWVLRLMIRVVNLCYTLLPSLPVTDASNSLRVYRAERLRGIPLRCEHFGIIEEVLVKMRRRLEELVNVEVPVTFRKRMFGETKRDFSRSRSASPSRWSASGWQARASIPSENDGCSSAGRHPEAL